MTIVSDVEIRLRADIARLQQDLNRARAEVNGAINGMSQAVEKFKGLLGSMFAVGSILAIAHEVIAAQREFDKLNTSLITATGSSKNAAQAFAALQKFAASTPYDLKQTTEAFLKLRNLGLMPSERALTSYGNTAGAMGKDLMQLVEAVADATTGEFERLKEFGIKAKQEGDKVSLTFQGVTTKIGNNAAAIEKYLMDLGETKFAGGMELQAKTLDGAISALGDSWRATLRTFAQSGFGDATKEGVLGLTEALGNLQSITMAVAGQSKNAKGEVEGFSLVSATLTPIFETIALVGNDVAFTFRVLGREIAGFAAGITTFAEGVANGWRGLGTAAKGMFENGWGNSDTVLKGLGQTVDSLKGSFTGMLAISQEITEQSAADRIATDARAAAIIGAAAARKKAAEEEAKDTSDQLAQHKILGDTRKQQTDAEKKAATEALAFYTKTREASIDQLQVLEQERDGQMALSSEEKKRVEILNDLVKFGKSLTAQQRSDIKGWAEAIPVLAKYNKELEKSKALRAEREGEAYTDVGAANAQTQALQDQIKYYGLTEEAVLKLKAAEIELGITSGEIDDIERGRLQGLLDATNEQIKLQTRLSKMKSETTFWTGLESTAKSTFLSIANGSKDTATRLKETFKNIFFDWLYQMTVQKWIINIGTSISGGGAVSGIVNALGGSSSGGSSIMSAFSSGGSLLSIGKTIYQGFATGVASSLGGSIASLGNLFGSSAVSAFGTGMTLTASQASTAAAAYAASGNTAVAGGLTAGAGAASAVPIIGWIIAGMAAANGFMKQGFTPNNDTITNPLAKAFTAPTNMTYKALEKLGVGKTLANILSGAAINTKLFGRADPRVESMGLRGTISAAGIDADTYANIIEKGGIFRSSKRYTNTADLGAETDKAWDGQIKNMITAVKGFGTALGIQTNVIDSYTKAFDIKLTGDETKDNEAVTALFAGISDELSTRLVPSLASFQAEGETLSATLLRVVNDYVTTDAALTAIGKTFGVMGVAGIEARERLIAAAGGLDAFVSAVTYFQQNYLTEAEQIAPLQKQVADSLAALGMSSVKTTDQFKAAVMGIDVSTQAGADLFAQLMALAPAFKTVADYADELSGVVRKSAAEVRSERAGLQNQLDQLIMTPAQLAEKARNAIDASNRDLYDQIIAGQARLDRVTALNTETTAIQAVIDKSKAWISTLKDANNSLALSAQSPLTPLEKYEEARRQLEATLARARAGDAEAQSALSSIEQAFLSASQVVNAGDAKYASDYAMVINANKEAIAWASKQVSIDEQSLTAMQQQVALLNNLTTSASTIAQLLAGDYTAYSASSGSDAMVAEIKGLRADNAALTARVDQLITEQREQTGAIITATVDSNVTAAQTVVGGVDDSAQTTARAAMLKEEATYV